MPEPEVATEVIPPVEEVKVEVKAEPKAPKIDSSKSMNQQADNFLKQIPEVKEEPKKDDTKPESAGVDVAKVDGDGGKPAEKSEEAPEEPKLEALPEWQKYVLERLPQIQVLGHAGENGKDKVYSVKSYTELPSDFEFSSRRDELAFNAALASQEYKANELVKEYQQEEQKRQNQEWASKDAVDVEGDIKRLQKEGLLPKFQYESNDPKFDTDPAVKEANEIYDLRQKINAQYYQQKRNYYISYEDAAHRYYSAKGREAKVDKPVDKAPEKPVVKSEREKVAERITPTQGADPGKTAKRMPPGSNMRDVLKLYNAGKI